MREWCGNVVLFGLLTAVVGGLWAYADAKAFVSQSRGYFPPLGDEASVEADEWDEESWEAEPTPEADSTLAHVAGDAE